jgi:hypothetical protein
MAMAIPAIPLAFLCTLAESATWGCYPAAKSPIAASHAIPLQAFILLKNMRLWTGTAKRRGDSRWEIGILRCRAAKIASEFR